MITFDKKQARFNTAFFQWMPFWGEIVETFEKMIFCNRLWCVLTNLTMRSFCKENQFFRGVLFVYLKKENTFAVRLLSLLADCIIY